MLHKPGGNADDLRIEVSRVMPDYWPSAASPQDVHFTVFQSREFIGAWLASFGQDRHYQPLFVTVSDVAGEPLLLLPLCLERRGPIEVLTFLDQGHADYNAPVLLPAVSQWLPQLSVGLWPRLVAALPHFTVAQLEKMPDQVGDLANPMRGLATREQGQSCHGNRLDIPWKQVEKSVQRPGKLRSKYRSLEGIGQVRFVVAQDESTRRQLLEALITQKQRRFEQTRVPGFAENPNALAFLRAATETFADVDRLLVCGLFVDDVVTAVQWGLVQETTFYALMTSFEGGSWTRYSCGRVLNFLLMQWLHERSFSYFDQGYGDETYKVQNSDFSVHLSAAEIAVTVAGRAYLLAGTIRARLRKLPVWERLRQLKWILLRRFGRSAPLEIQD